VVVEWLHHAAGRDPRVRPAGTPSACLNEDPKKVIKSLRGRVIVGAAALLMTASMAACGGDTAAEPGTGAATALSGDVKVDGSSAVAPLSKAAADFYADEQSKVNVTIGTSGTDGGFTKFCAGETDISDASRTIQDAEKAECDKNAITFVELPVANDALSVVVNKANTWVDCMTVPQLKAIWEPGSKVNNWNKVDPKFPDEPLKLFGAATDSGTFDYFTAAINGAEKASRTDYTPTEDDNVTVQGVSGSKGGLGYFGFTSFEDNADNLKLLKIDGGAGCVEPSVATTLDGTYKPLSRPLFVYFSSKSIAKPQVKDFINFYITEIDQVVEKAKFIPLTAKQKKTLAAEHATLKG
jgi:phosphate transport system substrate-binding protein